MSRQKMTREQILQIATFHEFYVHKYAWGTDHKRKLARRMAKDGLLTMVRQDREHFYYKAAK